MDHQTHKYMQRYRVAEGAFTVSIYEIRIPDRLMAITPCYSVLVGAERLMAKGFYYGFSRYVPGLRIAKI